MARFDTNFNKCEELINLKTEQVFIYKKKSLLYIKIMLFDKNQAKKKNNNFLISNNK